MFDVIPMGAPRMTQADKWKTNPNHPDPNYRQREVVTRYFQVKNTMLWQAVQMKFELGDVLEAIYFLPMPDSWSQKKKDAMIGTIHDSKPDVDNISKLCQDVFKKDDSAVWWNNCRKYWAYTGAILIYQQCFYAFINKSHLRKHFMRFTFVEIVKTKQSDQQ